jgi:hypothetical protein
MNNKVSKNCNGKITTDNMEEPKNECTQIVDIRIKISAWIYLITETLSGSNMKF